MKLTNLLSFLVIEMNWYEKENVNVNATGDIWVTTTRGKKWDWKIVLIIGKLSNFDSCHFEDIFWQSHKISIKFLVTFLKVYFRKAFFFVKAVKKWLCDICHFFGIKFVFLTDFIFWMLQFVTVLIPSVIYPFIHSERFDIFA